MFVLGPRALSWSRVRSRKWNWTIRETAARGCGWSRLAELVVSCCQSSPSVRPFGVRSSQTRTPPPFEVGGGYTLFYLAKGHPQGGWRPRPTLIASERPDKARLVYVCARAPGRRSTEVEEKEENGRRRGEGRWGDGYVRSQAFSSGSHLLSVGLLPSGSRHGVLQSLADWINLAADPRTTWKNQTTRCEKARTGNKGAGGQGGVLAVISTSMQRSCVETRRYTYLHILL